MFEPQTHGKTHNAFFAVFFKFFLPAKNPLFMLVFCFPLGFRPFWLYIVADTCRYIIIYTHIHTVATYPQNKNVMHPFATSFLKLLEFHKTPTNKLKTKNRN